MAQLQKAEGQVELKCDADKFFEIWGQNPSLVSNMCPIKFPKVELNEGECWDRVGSVITWSYVIDEIGEHAFVKTRVEECDKENKLVSYNYLGGHIVEQYYKTLKSRIQAIPKDEGCTVKWTLEYEKMNENAPEADLYTDYLLGTAKDIDACLCNV
ncbi:MLP-like protein 28 [Chenopodium quinoa]|uniref:MLP-like protein 28 n=1 Tax=Chenopodium quinoa TaxID=63459 RepID=UPI000B77509A|nr:MLP-like protein 28 [Chenopodium quinoa]